MMILNRLSLRYALPLSIIFLTLCFTIGEVAYTLKNREMSIQNNLKAILRSDGTRLSAQIEQILRSKEDITVQKQNIRRLFSLYLTGSTVDLVLLNKEAEEIVSASLHHNRSENLTVISSKEIKKVSKSGTNLIDCDEQRRLMKGFFSVRMPPKAGQLSHDGYGTIIISTSYEKILGDEHISAYKSLILRLSAIFIIVTAIILFLRNRVIIPVAGMRGTIQKILHGDETARMEVQIQDELGEIATSFNDMIETLNRQKMELEHYKNNLENQVNLEITKRLEHEAIMMQQSRLAAMGEMIGNIAHQWRQPLNVLGLIIVNLEDANTYGELTQELLQKSAYDANQVIQKMSTTIDDFRNFFEPDKQKATFNIQKVISDTVSLLESALNQSAIEVIIQIDSSLEMVGYKNEFSQVIMNLLSNSKDVLEERSVANGKIHIDAIKDQDNLILRVRDNGGGIPNDILTRIFDPYVSTKEEGKGSGIGLYMSKTIIEEHHHGRLQAANDDNGAVFTLTFRV